MLQRNSALRQILGLALCGLLVGGLGVGTSRPAAAFGMGGFGGPGVGHFAGPGPRMAGPRQGPGRVGGLPPGRNGGYPGGRTAGRHPIGVPVVGGGGSGPVPPPAQVAAGGNNRGGMPPRGERRLVPHEIITEFLADTPQQAIDQLARRYNLTPVESQAFALTGSRFDRWRINGNRPLGDLIGALEDNRLVASVQPNYVYVLQMDAPAVAPEPHGDPAQYVLAKLQIEEAHHVATGRSIRVAVIDSGIDSHHPDLAAAVVASVDELGGETRPHPHGTSMAGAIAAHGRLLGIAPRVELLAARAFDDSAGEARGNSFTIYKSLQWAADNGARVVNMSFAGPPDPALHRLLTAAYEKGIVLIAAAGNAGPNSPPLYPAADPDVIAVTATDTNNAVFKMANRGQYITIAAPGVEILALAPDSAYLVTTGTSVAAAHVSGVAALLLERKPSLKPADIRSAMMKTGAPLGAIGGSSDPAADLVNAYRAVSSLGGGKDENEQAKQ